MKKLTYYKFDYSTTESNTPESPLYGDVSFDKLYTRVPYDSDKAMNNQLFFPKNNQQFSACEKIPPDGSIVFHDYIIDSSTICLDDFMEVATINSCFGFFVSPKLKHLLMSSDLTLPAHTFYPVKLVQDPEFPNLTLTDAPYDWYFMLIASNDLEINYPKSTYVEEFSENTQVPITHHMDLLEIGTKRCPDFYGNKFIEEKVVVFDNAPDIYPTTSIYFYFSERLKNLLEAEGITGYSFWDESDKIKFFSTDSM